MDVKKRQQEKLKRNAEIAEEGHQERKVHMGLWVPTRRERQTVYDQRSVGALTWLFSSYS
jgi:DNA mismatch repair protein MutH